jgi:hypothetical protein
MEVGTGRQNTADMLAACPQRGTAAELCANYVLSGIGGWFLPSRDELALMYRNLKATGIGDFRDAGMADNCQYWTSSHLAGDRKVDLMVQAFNVFNTRNLQAQFGGGRVSNAQSNSFGRITSARPSRQIELAVRAMW